MKCDTVPRATQAILVAHFTTRNTQFPTRHRVYKLSIKADGLVQAVERGERVAAIRKARDMSGEEFSALVVKAAKAIGVRLFRPVPKPGREEDEA